MMGEGLERQVAELQALESMWMDDLLMDVEERANFRLAADIASGAVSLEGPSSGGLNPVLSGRLALSESGEHEVVLRFTLPRGYPSSSSPRLQITCKSSREVHERLTAAVADITSRVGDESLLLAVDCLRARVMELPGMIDPSSTGGTPTGEAAPRPSPSSTQRPSIGRKVIWFHHIKALTKRKHIMEWAQELQLGGFSKPGFPGIVVIEGLLEDTDEFVNRLKQLRWQAIAVRAEESEQVAHAAGSGEPESGSRADPVAAARRMSAKFAELSESGMTELSQQCREAGMEELFLAALKIVR